MTKKSILAALAACLLAGPTLAEEGAAGGDYPLFPNVPEAALLDGLSFSAVVLKTVKREFDDGGQKQAEGELSFKPQLHGWVREALGAMGFRLTGAQTDPSFVLLVNCGGKECSTTAWIQRDTYLLRVEGGRQFLLRLPGRFVTEYFEVATSSLADAEGAQKDAAFRSVRAALLSMASHVAAGNSPEALARYRWIDAGSAPQGAKAARQPTAAR